MLFAKVTMIRLWMPLLVGVSMLLQVSALRAQQSWYPIVGDDGARVANHRVPVELTNELDKLPGAVVVGNPRGTVTVHEFYDLNCPFCRKAAADMHAILQQEKELRLVLVPYPVLGMPSVQAGRIELAVAKTAPPATFYAFHRKIFQGRGVVDAQRAATVAKELGLDLKRLAEIVNDASIMETMKAHANLGNALGLAATPSFIVMDAAILGYPGKKALSQVIRSAGQCGRVVCKPN
jgi:protein-disulfide isomerase